MSVLRFSAFVGRRHGTGEPVGRPHKRTTSILLLLILLLLPIISHAQKPGAFYFGDSDSNGVIEVPDLITLNTVLGDFSADDTLLYSGYPQSRYRQDLDGNGIIEVPDLIILNSWVPGDFSSNPGAPDRLLLDGATHLNLNLGDSVSLSAYALSPIAAGSQVRTGFGVIFKIDPSSTCATAQIRGYDVAGGATVNAWRSSSAYHYTLLPAAPDNGKASIRVNTNGCSNGQIIKVEVYIPDDTEAGVVPGRFPTRLSTAQKFVVTVMGIAYPDTFITAYPPDPTNSQNANFEFTCSTLPCTYECKLDLESWAVCTFPKTYIGSDSWTATTITNAPSARRYHRAVWTGSEMIVWGGSNGSNLNSGGRYNPVTDSWTATSTTNAPAARIYHTAVWTGTEMIIWGGNTSYLNTGGRYNPSTDSWTATTTTNAPSGRAYHPAVWTGDRMIIWGGRVSGGSGTNTGGIYNPSDDSWTATSTGANVPDGRWNHSAVWTETEMIVWGGYNGGYLNTGGRYNPSTDSWIATSTTNAPSARQYHSSVWTGAEMIIWGGYNGSMLNTGGRYNPITNSWVATSLTNAPSIRRLIYNGTGAVWTGTEMIIWGGDNGSPYANDGGRYNPLTDNWTATSTTNAPIGRYGTDLVWTGTKMIAWGGYNGGYLNTGGVYFPGGGTLVEGDHTFEVRAYDLAMNVDPTPASYDWTIDLTPPDTSINSYPNNPSNSENATFEFSCNETGCTFECKMDSGAWTACVSPKDYLGLSNSSHTFQVRATDAAGNLDATPASYTWTIDITPPETYIDTHPPDPTAATSAEFTFHCGESGCTFECNLDSLGWEPCDSPVSYSSLLAMTHIFEVRATDSLGNTDQTPASFQWTIDHTPPETTITANPANPDTHNWADFSFACNEPPCTFECSLDSGGWSSCASPKHFIALTNNSHNFQVRAIDQVGNVDPSPASYSWTVNASPPDTFISSQPPDPSNSKDAAFAFYCTPGPCTFQCKVDAGAWAGCGSPKNYSPLANGGHAFSVRAIDLDNNIDTSPALYTWTIEGAQPDTSITSHLDDPTSSRIAVFGFICDIPPCTFECRLDAADWEECSSPKTYNSTGQWTPVSATDAPSAREWHEAVWTGTEMIVWGGSPISNTGGRYDTATDTWLATSTVNAPCARVGISAVWTGSEMIIWGGQDASSAYLNDGFKYDPPSDSWTAVTTANAPSVRWGHSAVWTGNEMIVWGGYGSGYTNSGGRYDPATDSWIATSTGTNVPSARYNHTAIWTGNEMIIWGGVNISTYYYTGGRYVPATDSWTSTSTTNVPSARYGHSAVWTGTEMIVWGGVGPTVCFNTGGRYNPSTNTWATVSVGENVPAARACHSAVWTGTGMIVWAGEYWVSPSWHMLNDGSIYDPATDTWTLIDAGANVPSARAGCAAVWTGDEMIAWGGGAESGTYMNDGGRFTLEPGLWDQGEHTFEVRAYDQFMNMDPTPASFSWNIDLSIPETTITSGGPCPYLTNVSFSFTSNKSDATFECQLDGGGWSSCASPKSYSGLSLGDHNFQVRATSQGKTDPSPASYSWTILPGPDDDQYEENDSWGYGAPIGVPITLPNPGTGCLDAVANDDDYYQFGFLYDLNYADFTVSSTDNFGNINLCGKAPGRVEQCSASSGNNEGVRVTTYSLPPANSVDVWVTLNSGIGIQYQLCWEIHSTCGNGTCDMGHMTTETPGICPWDCACVCGDGICENNYDFAYGHGACYESMPSDPHYCPQDCP